MAIPLSQLPADLLYKGQLDVSNPVKQAKYNQLNADYERNNSGGGNSGGGGGGGGFQPLSAPDLVALQNKVFEQMKPYYLQLLRETNGDLTRAVGRLKEDYAKGVRVANEDFNLLVNRQQEDIKNTLSSLGISNLNEQESAIDKLNQRGFAVGQQGFGMTPNVLNPSSIVQSPQNSTVVQNPANLAVGRGGVELSRLQESQRLRQEAIQRSADRAIEDLGIKRARETNVSNDPSQRGRLETEQFRGTEDVTRQNEQAREKLYDQLQSDVFNKSTGLGQVGIRADQANLNNLYNNTQRDQFINIGSGNESLKGTLT